MCVRLYRIYGCGHKTDLGTELCPLRPNRLLFPTRKCPAFVPRERHDLGQPTSRCPNCLDDQEWARAVGLFRNAPVHVNISGNDESVVRTFVPPPASASAVVTILVGNGELECDNLPLRLRDQGQGQSQTQQPRIQGQSRSAGGYPDIWTAACNDLGRTRTPVVEYVDAQPNCPPYQTNNTWAVGPVPKVRFSSILEENPRRSGVFVLPNEK